MTNHASSPPQTWEQAFATVATTMRDWRRTHPRATFLEIEEATDAELRRVRARMVGDLAEASPSTQWSTKPRFDPDRPRCPDGGALLLARGPHTRTVLSRGGRDVSLRRDDGACPHCGRRLFPPG